MPQTNPTVDQLRNDIDSGRTRDKVQVSDPAAAPLGADDEAAGVPASSERVLRARQQELAAGSTTPKPKKLGAASILFATIVVPAIMLVAGWYFAQ